MLCKGLCRVVSPPRMPYSRSRRTRKRKVGRKRTRMSVSRPVAPRRHVTPFPAQFKIKLVYAGWVHDGRAGNGTTGLTSYQFKLNSPYDPYAGSTGIYNIQPYFWDQVTALYKRYVVTGAKVEYKACPPTGIHAFTVIRPSTVSTSPSDLQLEESRPNAKKLIVSNGGNGAYFKRYYDIARIHGVKRRKIEDDDLYSGLVTGDPTLLAYLNIIQGNADGTTTDNPMAFNVKITQYITLYDRTIVSAS